MKTRLLLTAAGIALLLAAPLQAQTITTGGSFDALSPGNQKIANSLFNAQTTTGTRTPLTRDQIADLKKSEGWGQVFKQMKTDGLIQARNLGQVVSGHFTPSTAATTTTGATTSAAATRAATTSASATTRTAATRGRFTAARTSARTRGFGSARFAGGFRGTRGFSHAPMGGGFRTSGFGGGLAHPVMGGGGFGHGGGGFIGGGMGGGGFGHGGGGHGR